MVEGVNTQDADNGGNDVFVRDDTVLRETLLRVLFVLTAEAHDDVGDGFLEEFILGFVACLQSMQFRQTICFQLCRMIHETIRFPMIHRTHVGLRDRGNRTEDRLLTTSGTRTVTRNERLVIAAHHEVIPQGGRT